MGSLTRSIAPRRPPRAPVLSPQTHWPRSPTLLEPALSAGKRACTCACTAHAQVHARLPAESGGLEQCRASRPVGLRAEDGGAWRAAWCDAASQASHEELALPTWKDGHAPSRTQHTQEAQAVAWDFKPPLIESMGRRDGGIGLGRGPAGLAMAQDSVKQVGGLTRGKSAVKQVWQHQHRMPGMNRRSDAKPRC